MKNILKVTILFSFIIACFAIPSFADSVNFPKVYKTEYSDNIQIYNSDALVYSTGRPGLMGLNSVRDLYYFRLEPYKNERIYIIGEAVSNDSLVYWTDWDTNTFAKHNWGHFYIDNKVSSDKNLYYEYDYSSFGITGFFIDSPVFNTLNEAVNAFEEFLDIPPDPTPSYIKNPNVDEFIANTMISMGVKFDTPAYALSFASDAWNWCIDEDNMESVNPFDEWNIDSFVSYCNAQSNNYLNWYNGYKVSKDVTNALGEYIRQNIQLLNGLPSGVTSLTSAYMPIYHYGSGFNSGTSSPTAQTFYPAQTITYFNGEYVNETNDISTSQFLYTPADVRRFLGYPGSSPAITPSSPTGTGTITNDTNNPDQKNISINFPSLDWLADAIKSILDFLRDAFTTLANLLTQLLDAILGLFSDAFESLQDFGQGIIDFIQSVFSGLSDLLNGYVPSDISVIIVTFIALNFGIGLITFVLKGH